MKVLLLLPELQMWLELSLGGKTIKSFFEKNNIKNIAIYGCAYLGERLFDEANKYGVEVKYCIDREVNEFCGMSVLKPSQIDTISGIDLVIMCVSRSLVEMCDIRHVLEGKAHFVTLRDILQICLYKEVLLPFCESIGVFPYIFSWILQDQLKNLSTYEKMISSIYRAPDFLKTNPPYLEYIYSSISEYGDEYIQNVFTQSPVIKKGNTVIHSDINSKYVNITQGIRFTHGMPEMFNKTVHLLGNCVALGYGVDDSRTIASYLQAMLNTLTDINGKFRVLNHGVWGMPRLAHDFKRKLNSLHYNKGDIVIFLSDPFLKYNDYIFNLWGSVLNEHRDVFFCVFEEFCKPREGKPLYFDFSHLSYWGMERVAQYMFNILKNEKIVLGNAVSDLETTEIIQSGCTVPQRKNETLEDYLSFLRTYKRDNDSNGAIVMNCNPFTNGHRYLIETAAKNIENLYVFVVEEDKSVFTFEDRIKLVKLGTADLRNVIVIPSGKFIISSITFPEYFVKDALKNIIINPSHDIEVFAKKIAPALNISKRFVGQEPLDPITAQYNQAMKDILPKYNIDVVIIERLNLDSEPISASRVRRLLELKMWDDISKLVPATTLKYLKDRNFT